MDPFSSIKDAARSVNNAIPSAAKAATLTLPFTIVSGNNNHRKEYFAGRCRPGAYLHLYESPEALGDGKNKFWKITGCFPGQLLSLPSRE